MTKTPKTPEEIEFSITPDGRVVTADGHELPDEDLRTLLGGLVEASPPPRHRYTALDAAHGWRHDRLEELEQRRLEQERKEEEKHRAWVAAGGRTKTAAERKSERRDTLHAAKVAAVPPLDRDALRAERDRRCKALADYLASGPMPHALRHLHPHDYADAWLARELAKAPDEMRRTGRPRTVARVAEIYDDLRGYGSGYTDAKGMRKKLAKLDELEKTVWAPPGAPGA